MASGAKWTTHNDFSKGMSQDQPSYLLPDGFVFDAKNVLITKTGQLRKRYGNIKHTSDTDGTVIKSIATVRNFFSTVVDRGYVAYRDGTDVARVLSFQCQETPSPLTPTSGSPRGYATFRKGYPGVPTSWSGHAIFPLADPNALAVGSVSPFFAMGGSQIGLPASQNTGACTVTAGNDTITTTNPITNVQPGDYLFAQISGTREYIGRIKEAVTTTSFRVEPTPTASFAATSGTIDVCAGNNGTLVEANPADRPMGCKAITVFQNRIVIGNVQTDTFANSGKANRIYWSTLLTQPADSPVANVDGIVPFLKAGWLKRNYETFANMSSVVSIVPLGPSTLLILGDTGVSLISGTLGTISADTTTSSYSVRVLSSSIGCISAASVQVTPAGVIFASADGVYITDGNTFTNLCENKIKQLWRASLALGTTINGAAILEDRIYALSTTANSTDAYGGTFFCDLSNNFAWTRTRSSNAESMPFLMSAQDPSPESNRVYVVGNYTDATVCKHPQLIRLDTIFPRDYSPFILDVSLLDGTDVLTGGGIVDANNTSVLARVVSKAYTEGDPNTLRRFRHSTILASVEGDAPANAYLYADYVLGTSPSFSWIAANKYTFGTMTKPSAIGTYDQSFRTRFDTNMNAQAVSYVIGDYHGESVVAPMPSWTLYEITTATNQLRAGRTGNGLTPDSTSTLVS